MMMLEASSMTIDDKPVEQICKFEVDRTSFLTSQSHLNFIHPVCDKNKLMIVSTKFFECRAISIK